MFQNFHCLDTLFVYNVDARGMIYIVTGGGMLAFQNKMIHIQVVWRGKKNNHLHHTTHGVHVFLWVVPHQRGQSQTSHLPAMIKIACQQALCWGKGWKNCAERGRKGWEPADHLSARSLSVTWIHWNVINFACQKGFGRQHTAFTLCQNAAFSNEFFLWWVDYALEGLVLTEKMWFLALISYRGSWHAYWFSAVIVSCHCDLPSDAGTFIAAKKNS